MSASRAVAVTTGDAQNRGRRVLGSAPRNSNLAGAARGPGSAFYLSQVICPQGLRRNKFWEQCHRAAFATVSGWDQPPPANIHMLNPPPPHWTATHILAGPSLWL